MAKRKTVHRSSITGRFVKKGQAKRNSRTTETEQVRTKRKCK